MSFRNHNSLLLKLQPLCIWKLIYFKIKRQVHLSNSVTKYLIYSGKHVRLIRTHSCTIFRVFCRLYTCGFFWALKQGCPIDLLNFRSLHFLYALRWWVVQFHWLSLQSMPPIYYSGAQCGSAKALSLSYWKCHRGWLIQNKICLM